MSKEDKKEEKSISKLKAEAYDIVVKIEQLNQMIRQEQQKLMKINDEIEEINKN